ncbi:MAG: DUF2281 domain-containing protein [Candidatus Kapabacteria bacterium]|nr:DUF2281 domain-containing protein [Candidatus Kapabacteria bacterium]
MSQILSGNAIFKKPNILILDAPLDIDLKRVYVQIQPIIENGKNNSILGMFKGMFEISDDFDEPLEEFSEYM